MGQTPSTLGTPERQHALIANTIEPGTQLPIGGPDPKDERLTTHLLSIVDVILMTSD